MKCMDNGVYAQINKSRTSNQLNYGNNMKKSVNKILAVMYIFLAAFSVFFIAETTVHAAAPILENSNLLKVVPISDGVQGENLINNPTFARSAKDKNPPGWYVFVNRYDMQYASQPVEAKYPFENVDQKVCTLERLTNNTGTGPWAYGNTGTTAMVIDPSLSASANFAGTVDGGSYSDVYAYYLNTENAKSNMGITLLLAQTVKVKPGSTYRFGMRSWANNGVDAGHRRYVVIYPNKFVSGPDGSPAAYYGGQEIADMFSTYTVPDGVTEITVSIRLALPAGQKKVYGDVRGLYLEEVDDEGSTGPGSGVGTVQPVKVEYYKDGTLDTKTELSDGVLGQGYTVPEKDYGNNYEFDYAMVNGEKVDSLPIKGYFSTSEQTVKMYYKDIVEDKKWLPNYTSRWKNSMTETIPKQNAFVMMETADTKIDSYDLPLVGGKPIAGSAAGSYQIHLTGGKTSWIKFKNVGFYNGKNIGVKVSVKPEKTHSNKKTENVAFIGYTGHYFLNVAISKDMSSAEVQYDFFDSETGEPVNISAYWTIFNLNKAKTFTINLDEFDNVYSVDRQYREDDVAKPIEVKYEANAQSLTLMGVKENVVEQPIQGNVTFTINDTNHFKYKMTSTSENPYDNLEVGYDAQTEAFVEIPDPVGETQVFDTITADNYPDEAGKIEKPLNYQFYQYVPYESKRNRGRAIEWTLPEEMNGSVIENGNWIVKDESNQIVSDRFTFEDGKMVPKDGQDMSFYNHYYFFQKNLVIDDQNPIDETDLLAKDDQGHRYFDYTGEVILNTDGLAPVSSEVQSKINFAANFEYTYKLLDSKGQIVDFPNVPADAPKIAASLITHSGTSAQPNPPAILEKDGKRYQLSEEQITPPLTDHPILYTNNPVQLVYEEIEEWLPDFPDRWKNSMTEPIPKQNAFVMMEMADTEIVDYDLPLVDGKPITAYSDETYQIHLDAGKTSWIKFKNVGFYNGKNIGVKVSVTPEKDNETNGMEKYAYIGYTGHYFLNVAVTKDMSSAEVQYDFFDSETGEPVSISSYWTIFNLNTAKTFTINLDEFDEVYSVDRQYKENDVAKPIEIKYEQTADSLTLMGTKEKVENDQIIQGSATFTLKDTDHFKYKMTSTAENSYNNLQIAYDAQTEAFVEIPDPVGETQVFDTITADNYPDEAGKIENPLNYQFYQYVPYESKRNRGRAIEWTLPEKMNGSVIENGEWVVKDESNQIVSDRFTFEDGKMIPKYGQDESFYNHYYFFQKNLVIDDQKPIDETDLLAKDDQGRRYFDYTGEVILNTDGLAPVSSEIHSKINFAAEAEFESVYRDEEDHDTIKPIPESSAQTEKDLLITHNYQEVTPPAIDGYEYADESIPANYAELPVRYTQAEDNKVQLLYVINGELFFDIPEEMNFQKVSIPTIFKKTEYLQTIDPDWAIKVTDERSAKQRTPWKLSAQIADQSFYTHTDSEYQSQKADSEYEENIPLMSNILRFANADGAANDLTQSVVIYDSGDEPQAYDEYPIQWTDKNTGFFLDLQAFGYYPEGKYRATIDFTVEYVE